MYNFYQSRISCHSGKMKVNFRNYGMIILVVMGVVAISYYTVNDLKGKLRMSGGLKIEEIQMEHCQKIIDDRAVLSKMANSLLKQKNQMKCVMHNNITNTGGWCSSHVANRHVTDLGLAYALARMFANKTIGSLGDGPGAYKSILLNTSLVSVYDSYDGSPFIENITNGMVKFLDLTIPHYGFPVYDWIFSIEVAEHIPAEYEDIYLGNLIRHAREGILISWAVPGQGGTGHVNGQTHEHVINKLSPCFVYDYNNSATLRSEAGWSWLKNNLMVFQRSQDCILNKIQA